MNEDSPNGSPYETLAKHDQSETKRDRHVDRDDRGPVTFVVPYLPLLLVVHPSTIPPLLSSVRGGQPTVIVPLRPVLPC
jgi:hypothetical protein